MELIFIQGQNVTDKNMLADAPVLDELNKSHVPAVAERSGQQTDAGAGLTLALTGVNHHHSRFGFIILKSHIS